MVRTKDVKENGKEMIMSQGRVGTQTRNLANGLPCSNQLSYQVIRELNAKVQIWLSCQEYSCSWIP